MTLFWKIAALGLGLLALIIALNLWSGRNG